MWGGAATDATTPCNNVTFKSSYIATKVAILDWILKCGGEQDGSRLGNQGHLLQ